MLKQVAVSALQPGMMITRVVEQSGSVKIRKVGMVRSPEMVQGLTEMGVTLVEVDLDQSLNIDPEHYGDLSNNGSANTAGSAATKTATQQLVATDKNISNVDRQLSQQFHRSLFMPAVEQMPSKWTLYTKPYAILFAYVVVGLLLGGVSSYLIVEKNVPAIMVGMSPTIGPNIQESPSAANNNTSEELASTEQNNEVENPSIQQASSSEDKVNKDSQISNAAESFLQDEAVDNADTAQNEETIVQRELVNGVLLEEGQQVLGYNGSDEDDVIPQNNNNSNNSNNAPINNTNTTNNQSSDDENIINSELFRRIQRVAKDVDDQPPGSNNEPIKVTNLNDLPRIDQLSPALLTQMPAMSFSAHMFASNSQDRWVRVNSRRLGEGDLIANKVVLKRIEAEKVVLEYKGTEFTMNALSDW